MNRIKLSEQQDKELRQIIKENLSEMLDPNGGQMQLKYVTPNTPNTPGEIGNAIVKATKAAKKVPSNSNIDNSVSITADPDNDNKKQDITVSGDNKNSTFESFIISKKQLDEIRLMKLKENSKIVTVENFLK